VLVPRLAFWTGMGTNERSFAVEQLKEIAEWHKIEGGVQVDWDVPTLPDFGCIKIRPGSDPWPR